MLSFLSPLDVRPAQALTGDWAQQWRDDLSFARDSLPRAHPDWFHTVSRDRYQAALDSLARDLPRLAQHEVVVGLARAIALVSDGHTRLTFPFDSAAGFFTGHARTAPHKIPDLVFRHYPVRYGLFADGLYVIRADSAHRGLLGGRVVSIGAMSPERAMAAVEPVIHRDNDRMVAQLMPAWLACPEILHARGVVSDMERAPIVVQLRNGQRHTEHLEPAPVGATLRWLEARDAGEPPLRDRRPERRHWFVTLPGTRTVYARYREVQDDPKETVAEFADGLFREIASKGAEQLVIDLRGNTGGNGFLNRPLIQGLIRNERLWRPGALCALIDRGTFSAAVMAAADLEMSTPALLIGEKTGGSPNSFGDSKRIVLPHSGITVRVSSLYWQTTSAQDRRDGITPHLPVANRFEEWRANRDPALDRALSLVGARLESRGVWKGVVGWQFSRPEIEIDLTERGSRLEATVTAPFAELKQVPIENLRRDGVLISGGWTDSGELWRIQLRPNGQHVSGILRYKGVDFAVLLSRVPGEDSRRAE